MSEPQHSIAVLEGDTLDKIAKRTGHSAKEILASNPKLSVPGSLMVGQRLQLPPPPNSN